MTCSVPAIFITVIIINGGYDSGIGRPAVCVCLMRQCVIAGNLDQLISHCSQGCMILMDLVHVICFFNHIVHMHKCTKVSLPVDIQSFTPKQCMYTLHINILKPVITKNGKILYAD